ncbi:4'-phosphopantetheinyl transferase [Collimonas arenae]|uniref:4'-phosphopantetheinyl transferase n=1 Tax=Collimonas arenae TaxID=279058 RepID=A0A0A1FDL2_9BURK|nr:4'-phosphopantetheinyl transferase superfamily protein [Collimonas arenae]AIY41875.1 4'-phosphopantetheinyl transferase [Collimonas arenae]
MRSAVIWLFDANTLDEVDCARFLVWLSEAELLRYRRFVRPLRQREFLLGRILLRSVVARLAGIAFEAVQVIECKGRAPQVRLPDGCPIRPHLSLSHSRGWIACAASVDTPLGVDIEAMDGERDVEAIGRNAFSAAESKWLSDCPPCDRVADFYTLWSSKEALYKLMSVDGADSAMPNLVVAGVRLRSGPGWHARSWSLPGFSLTLCSRERLTSIERIYLSRGDVIGLVGRQLFES